MNIHKNARLTPKSRAELARRMTDGQSAAEGTVNLAQAERRRSAVVEYHADAVAATQVAMAFVRR